VSRTKIDKAFIKDVHPIFDEDEFLSFLVVKSMYDKILRNQKEIKASRRLKPLTTTKIIDKEIVKEILHLTGAIPI